MIHYLDLVKMKNQIYTVQKVSVHLVHILFIKNIQLYVKSYIKEFLYKMTGYKN